MADADILDRDGAERATNEEEKPVTNEEDVTMADADIHDRDGAERATNEGEKPVTNEEEKPVKESELKVSLQVPSP